MRKELDPVLREGPQGARRPGSENGRRIDAGRSRALLLGLLLTAGASAAGCAPAARLIAPGRYFVGDHVMAYWRERPGKACPEDAVCIDRAESAQGFRELVEANRERCLDPESRQDCLELIELDADRKHDHGVFIGAWEPRNGEHFFRMDMSWGELRAERLDRYRRGYRLIHLKVYRSFFEEKVAAIWEPMPTPGGGEQPWGSRNRALAVGRPGDLTLAPGADPDRVAIGFDFQGFLGWCERFRQEGFFLVDLELYRPIFSLRTNPQDRLTLAFPRAPDPAPAGCGWEPPGDWIGLPAVGLLPSPVKAGPIPRGILLSGVWHAGDTETRLLTGLACDPSEEERAFPGASPEDDRVYARCDLLEELEAWNGRGFRVADIEAYRENGSERYAVLLHRAGEGPGAEPGDDWLTVSEHLTELQDRDRQLRSGRRSGSPASGAALFPVDLDLLFPHTHRVDRQPLHQGLVHNGGTSGPPDG